MVQDDASQPIRQQPLAIINNPNPAQLATRPKVTKPPPIPNLLIPPAPKPTSQPQPINPPQLKEVPNPSPHLTVIQPDYSKATSLVGWFAFGRGREEEWLVEGVCYHGY
jgi:hypothetical protein